MSDEAYISHMKQYILEKEKELLEETFSGSRTGGKIKSDVVNSTLKELERVVKDEDKKD